MVSLLVYIGNEPFSQALLLSLNFNLISFLTSNMALSWGLFQEAGLENSELKMIHGVE